MNTTRRVTADNIECQKGRYGDPNCENKATVCETVEWDLGRQGAGTSFFYFCDDCWSKQVAGRVGAILEGEDETLQNALGDEFEIETKTLKQGDWVLYKGKPRRVYKFMPFGPTEEFPAIVRDPRYDKVELVEIKRPVNVSEVQRMTVEAF